MKRLASRIRIESDSAMKIPHFNSSWEKLHFIADLRASENLCDQVKSLNLESIS